MALSPTSLGCCGVIRRSRARRDALFGVVTGYPLAAPDQGHGSVLAVTSRRASITK